MQTYMGLVRNPADATLIFEACRQGKLPRIQRRLSDRERNAIRSGSIFVWDEKEAGMRRWTDGKSWSASRVAGSFLTYREMEGKRAVGDMPPGSRSMGQSGEDSDDNMDLDSQKYEMTESYKYKVDGLIKQSFSITTSEDQKLHLISYYGRSHPNNVHLRPPTQDPALMNIQIPRGLYPESTLELAGPPNQPGARLEEHRYSNHAAPIAPAPTAYMQQNMPPNYPPTSHHTDGHWDARDPRARDGRANQLYDQARDMSHEQSIRPPYPPNPSHMPQTNLPPTSLSHPQQVSSAQHPSMQQHPQTPQHPLAPPQHYFGSMSNGPPTPHASASFPPYGHPSSSHKDSYPPDYSMQQRVPNADHYNSQQSIRSPYVDHRPGLHTGNGEQLASQMTPARTENAPRRTSGPRPHEETRRASVPHFMPPQMAHTPDKHIPEPSTGPGQHIALPDLNTLRRMDPMSRPAAKDIPTDKLGKWQEDARMRDVLWSNMKI